MQQDQKKLEERARELTDSPRFDANKSAAENFGEPDDWVLDLNPFRLMLMPFTMEWWGYDELHDAWINTGYHAGEVTFSVRDGRLEPAGTPLPPRPAPEFARLFTVIQSESRRDMPDQSYSPSRSGKTCPACGSPLLPGRKYCNNCGAPVQEQDSGQSPAGFCTQCGAPLTPGKSFCGSCGKKYL